MGQEGGQDGGDVEDHVALAEAAEEEGTAQAYGAGDDEADDDAQDGVGEVVLRRFALALPVDQDAAGQQDGGDQDPPEDEPHGHRCAAKDGVAVIGIYPEEGAGEEQFPVGIGHEQSQVGGQGGEDGARCHQLAAGEAVLDDAGTADDQERPAYGEEDPGDDRAADGAAGHQQKDGAAEGGRQEEEHIAHQSQEPTGAVVPRGTHGHVCHAADGQVQDGDDRQHGADGRHVPQQQRGAADGQGVEQVYAAPFVHVLEGLDGAGDEEHQQEWDEDGGDLRFQVVGHHAAELFGQVFLGDVLPPTVRAVEVVMVIPGALAQVYHSEAEQGQPQTEEGDQAAAFHLPAVDLPELGKGSALTRGFCQGHSLPPPFH